MLIRHYETRTPKEEIILCDSCNATFTKENAKVYIPRDGCTWGERPLTLCNSCAKNRIEKQEPK